MTQIEIVSEQEDAAGWVFHAVVGGDPDGSRQLRLRLSWADYDLWCRGGDEPPSRVARAVLRFLTDRVGREGLRDSFDASISRRQFADADEQIPPLIGEVG